jgi:hypothetical protein
LGICFFTSSRFMLCPFCLRFYLRGSHPLWLYSFTPCRAKIGIKSARPPLMQGKQA